MTFSPSTRSATNALIIKDSVKEVIPDKEKSKDLNLPISRIKSIMKHAESTQNISQESVHVMTKVAELFLHHVVVGAFEADGQGKRLDYKHVADYVQTNDLFTVIRDILPRKITFREYKDIMKKKGIFINPDSEEDSSDSSSGKSSSEDDESDSSSSASTKNNK